MVKKLLKEIEQAFENTQAPGDADIVDPEWRNVDPEYRDIWERFRGKSWKAIAVADLVKRRNLTPLTPAALSYFLPAYMVLLLNNPEAADVLNFLLVKELTPDDNDSYKKERFLAIIDKLNHAQKRVIKIFLQYLCSHRLRWYEAFREPCRALDLYWNQF